jgi:hypothetical protein
MSIKSSGNANVNRVRQASANHVIVSPVIYEKTTQKAAAILVTMITSAVKTGRIFPLKPENVSASTREPKSRFDSLVTVIMYMVDVASMVPSVSAAVPQYFDLAIRVANRMAVASGFWGRKFGARSKFNQTALLRNITSIRLNKKRDESVKIAKIQKDVNRGYYTRISRPVNIVARELAEDIRQILRGIDEKWTRELAMAVKVHVRNHILRARTDIDSELVNAGKLVDNIGASPEFAAERLLLLKSIANLRTIQTQLQTTPAGNTIANLDNLDKKVYDIERVRAVARVKLSRAAGNYRVFVRSSRDARLSAGNAANNKMMKNAAKSTFKRNFNSDDVTSSAPYTTTIKIASNLQNASAKKEKLASTRQSLAKKRFNDFTQWYSR